MKKISRKILKGIVNICLCVAVLAAGTASFWGGHQPEEPDLNVNVSKFQEVKNG